MRIAVLALVFLAGPSFAQVQRCDSDHGVVFQQGPCASIGTPATPARALAPSLIDGQEGAGRQLCKEMAAVTFGDSSRIVVLRRWGTEIVKFRGVRETAITYELSIDEKSERTGYAGARLFYCFVDTQESRVFRISAPLRRQPIEAGL